MVEMISRSTVEQSLTPARAPPAFVVTRHPEKRNLVAVEEIPIFPDFDSWKYQYVRLHASGSAPATQVFSVMAFCGSFLWYLRHCICLQHGRRNRAGTLKLCSMALRRRELKGSPRRYKYHRCGVATLRLRRISLCRLSVHSLNINNRGFRRMVRSCRNTKSRLRPRSGPCRWLSFRTCGKGTLGRATWVTFTLLRRRSRPAPRRVRTGAARLRCVRFAMAEDECDAMC